MLVLSRKTQQRIMVGDDIVITVIEINRNRVKLGIQTPKEVPIHREEIWQAIQREKEIERERGGKS